MKVLSSFALGLVIFGIVIAYTCIIELIRSIVSFFEEKGKVK